jgi:hypothetical protein
MIARRIGGTPAATNVTKGDLREMSGGHTTPSGSRPRYSSARCFRSSSARTPTEGTAAHDAGRTARHRDRRDGDAHRMGNLHRSRRRSRVQRPSRDRHVLGGCLAHSSRHHPQLTAATPAKEHTRRARWTSASGCRWQPHRDRRRAVPRSSRSRRPSRRRTRGPGPLSRPQDGSDVEFYACG